MRDDKWQYINLSVEWLFSSACSTSRNWSAVSVTGQYLHGGRVISERTHKLFYLYWLGLALHSVLVLAAPLPGCGAFFSVPAALPPLIFLTSVRSPPKQIDTYSLIFIVRTYLWISQEYIKHRGHRNIGNTLNQFRWMRWDGFTFSARGIWLSSEGSWTDPYSSSCGPWLQHISVHYSYIFGRQSNWVRDKNQLMSYR